MSRFQRHQMTIGVVLLTVGVTLLFYWLYFSATGGPRLPELTAASRHFAGDFRDYWLAAGKMAQGNSPYDPSMLLGPVGSQGMVYRYPPVLAFLLISLSGLDYKRRLALGGDQSCRFDWRHDSRLARWGINFERSGNYLDVRRRSLVLPDHRFSLARQCRGPTGPAYRPDANGQLPATRRGDCGSCLAQNSARLFGAGLAHP